MKNPVLQDSAVLKSAEVLLGWRKQEEILRKSVDGTGEVGQQHLRRVDIVRIQTAKGGCRDAGDGNSPDPEICRGRAVDGVDLSAARVRRLKAALERMAAPCPAQRVGKLR